MWRLWLILGCFGALGAAVCSMASQEKTAAQSFVPGEVIVKFTPQSAAATLITSAAGAGYQPSAALASYVEALSRETGIPFRAKQVGSGGNLILEIQKVDLIARFLERVRVNPNVKQARGLAPGDPRTGVQVEFAPDSAEAKALAKVAVAGRETGPELDPIVERLKQASGVSFTAQITPSRQLLLTVDLSAVTLDLAYRLGKRADVEYAQPNFIRRRMGRAGVH